MTDTFRDLLNFLFFWNNSQQANPQNAVESQGNLCPGKWAVTGKGGERTTDDGRRKTEADREPQHVDALLIGETKKGRRQARIGKANGEAKADDGEAREEGREGG